MSIPNAALAKVSLTYIEMRNYPIWLDLFIAAPRGRDSSPDLATKDQSNSGRNQCKEKRRTVESIDKQWASNTVRRYQSIWRCRQDVSSSVEPLLYDPSWLNDILGLSLCLLLNWINDSQMNLLPWKRTLRIWRRDYNIKKQPSRIVDNTLKKFYKAEAEGR